MQLNNKAASDRLARMEVKMDKLIEENVTLKKENCELKKRVTTLETSVDSILQKQMIHDFTITFPTECEAPKNEADLVSECNKMALGLNFKANDITKFYVVKDKLQNKI